MGFVGRVDRLRREVVLPQQLDDPLGAARRTGDQQRGLAPLADPGDLGHPVRQPAVELHHGLTGHVPHHQRTVLVLPQLLQTCG